MERTTFGHVNFTPSLKLAQCQLIQEVGSTLQRQNSLPPRQTTGRQSSHSGAKVNLFSDSLLVLTTGNDAIRLCSKHLSKLIKITMLHRFCRQSIDISVNINALIKCFHTVWPPGLNVSNTMCFLSNFKGNTRSCQKTNI